VIQPDEENYYDLLERNAGSLNEPIFFVYDIQIWTFDMRICFNLSLRFVGLISLFLTKSNEN
jgi:hypothetical protein